MDSLLGKGGELTVGVHISEDPHKGISKADEGVCQVFSGLVDGSFAALAGPAPPRSIEGPVGPVSLSQHGAFPTFDAREHMRQES